MKAATEWKVNFVGWILFVVSALWFIVASVRSGDAVYVLGSIFFLLPYAARLRRSGSR